MTVYKETEELITNVIEGDSLSVNNDMKFSTPDQDNDMDSRICATDQQGVRPL